MSEENDFEKMIEEIQSKIDLDEETIFSKKVINEYRNPSNFGVIEKADAMGKVKGSCGDTMKITLKVENDRVVDVCFWTDGCGTSIACGSMLTKMIKGKTTDEASAVTSEELKNALVGLPDSYVHCAVLAVDTLHKTIENYLSGALKE